MKSTKILLIEDDYLDVESVKRALKKSQVHCELHVAHNGEDALSLLTGEKGDKYTPDVILLDINMPKMNGIEFLQIIKNYFSLSQIKTFVITTSTDEYDQLSTRSLGIEGYIVKPLDFRNESSARLLSVLKDEA
jgi:CheY-like chemotaxis protein